MWIWLQNALYDAWFYGWPYLIILAEVAAAIYFADKYFFEKGGKHRKRNPMEMEFREDHDKKDLPPIAPTVKKEGEGPKNPQ